MTQESAQPTYILGYSGIDGYLSYKNKHIDGLTKHESFVSQGMDAAAAIVKDGKIIAACAEERFTGQKHTGSFPKNAIDACLKIAGITINDVSLIALGARPCFWRSNARPQKQGAGFLLWQLPLQVSLLARAQ